MSYQFTIQFPVPIRRVLAIAVAALAILAPSITCAAAFVPPVAPDLGWDAGSATNNADPWVPWSNTPSADRAWNVSQVNFVETAGSFYAPNLRNYFDFNRAQNDKVQGIVDGVSNAPQFFQNLPQVNGRNATNHSATFEMWLNIKSLANNKQVLFESGGSGDGFSMSLENDVFRLQAKDGNSLGSVKTQLDPSLEGRYVQLVGVMDLDEANSQPNPTLTLYVNGQQATSVDDAGAGFFVYNSTNSTYEKVTGSAANPLAAYDGSGNRTIDWDGGNEAGLGSRTSTVGGTIVGADSPGELYIDDFGTVGALVSAVNYYQRALTQTEIQENFEAYSDPTVVNPQFGIESIDHQSTSIALTPYADGPQGRVIAFSSLLSYNETDDAVPRFYTNNLNALDLRTDEKKGTPQDHAPEDAGWLVVGPAPNNGETNIRPTDFGGLSGFRGAETVNVPEVTVTFPEAFDEVPVVLADMMTRSGSDPSYVRVFDVTTEGFKMQIDETAFDGASNQAWGHADETVGWLALEQGTFQIGDKILGEAVVADRETTAALGRDHSDTAAQDAAFEQFSFINPGYSGDMLSLVAGMYFDNDLDSGDSGLDDYFAQYRIRNLSTLGFEFAVENAFDFDDGVFGGASQFAYIAFGRVPEPSSVALLLTGLAFVTLGNRRKRR